MKNEDVFSAIENYSTDLYKFCMHLCRNKDSADELFQETFLKAAALSYKIDKSKNVLGFLFSVAVSVYKNEQRKNFRRSIIAPPAADFELELLADKSSIQDDAIEDIRKSVLVKLVSKLDSKYKVVIILFYGMELDIKNISEVLKCPVGTVKSRLSRGRQILKEEMEALGYGENEF